jgi:hypothetical protein
VCVRTCLMVIVVSLGTNFIGPRLSPCVGWPPAYTFMFFFFHFSPR